MLLGLLPSVLHVATAQPHHGPWLRSILDLLAHETQGSDSAGSATASIRLLDVLLIHVVRAWLNDSGDTLGASWLRGLRDPVAAGALAALHSRPGHNCTLEALAATVQVSRATLARRFTSQVGVPPLIYLTRWRLQVAAHQLRGTDDAVSTIARRVGYTSEYAFNRAFTRSHGEPPGRYRRHATAQLSA